VLPRFLFPIFSILLPIAATPAGAALDADQRARASSLFADYRKAMESGDHEAADAAMTTLMEDLPEDASEIAWKQISTEAAARVKAYRKQAEILLSARQPKELLANPQVAKDRGLLMEIRAVADEGIRKKRLAEEGWPAIERLEKNLLPDPKEILASDPALAKSREEILFRLELCDRLAKTAYLTVDTSPREQMESLENSGAGLAAIASGNDRRVLADNETIAAKEKVPSEEAEGIRDANRLRVLAGLPALALDPKLCLASRIHSEDMVKGGFFAHDSPVPGRKTPWDRAAAAGTSASAENIAAGHATGAAANRAWFHSPGHFINLFGNSRRIGLGKHENHWTQMFGN
jgi:uncharacterized protein YkwD